MPGPPKKKINHRRISDPAQFVVDSVDKDIAKSMVLTNHYSGKCPGIKHCFALYENGEVAGVIVYSVPASYTLCNGVCGETMRLFVVELARLVVTTKSANAASTLVGRSLKQLPDCIVVSYADCNEHVGHVGYVYQSTNWIYTGQGNAEPVWCHPTTGEVISYTRRHIDTKAAEFGLLWTDLTKRKQVGKHRYVTFTGSKRFKKEAAKLLRYKTHPYPKGPTNHHETTVMRTMEKPKPTVIDSIPLTTKPPILGGM